MTKNRIKLTPFGKEVAKRLIDLDMTKTDLAKEFGITPAYLNDILQGTRLAKELKPKIAKLLNLDYIASR
jgi:transcriptional regulator with XRE-family HTH domain